MFWIESCRLLVYNGIYAKDKEDLIMAHYFNNFIPSIVPNVPQLLQRKINFLTSIQLTDNECRIFSICLEDISIIIKKDGLENSLTQVHACFTPTGDFGFSWEGMCQASYAQLAVYNMQEIRKLGDEQIAFVFTEELVHHFWKYDDETETKYKVLEILQITEPHITKEYVKNWGLNW